MAYAFYDYESFHELLSLLSCQCHYFLLSFFLYAVKYNSYINTSQMPDIMMIFFVPNVPSIPTFRNTPHQESGICSRTEIETPRASLVLSNQDVRFSRSTTPHDHFFFLNLRLFNPVLAPHGLPCDTYHSTLMTCLLSINNRLMMNQCLPPLFNAWKRLQLYEGRTYEH